MGGLFNITCAIVKQKMITKEDVILITGASGFIGLNLIELFEEKDYKFVNNDKADVTKTDQHKYWHEGNIMDKDVLASTFEKYKPTIIIHLAARTDTASKMMEDYEFSLYSVKYRNRREVYYATCNVTAALLGGFSQDEEANIQGNHSMVGRNDVDLFNYWRQRKETNRIKNNNNYRIKLIN